jgi:tRNA (guanine-N7-)-methyltransferase
LLAVKRRIRHHVNPLKVDYLETGAGPLALPSRRPVEVELGCADARWLFERAALDPELDLVGVEIRQQLVQVVQRRVAAAGLDDRLRIVYANISRDVPVLFAEGAVARFVVNFPDPWFKRRQHKRRVVTPELAALLARTLRQGGELFFQSDVWEVALDALAVLEGEPSLHNERGPWSFLPENPYGARSLREVRCLERGLPIWRLLYRKRLISDRRPGVSEPTVPAPPAP